MQAQAETIRTVFSDPTNFNVKVRISMHSAFSLDADQWMAAQHPLYSPWTLWFDSPATKGRNLPQTPMTSFPQTPIPQTPGGIAAQGWMEDIKRVITFDSVEEFWGCVSSPTYLITGTDSKMTACITTLYRRHSYLKRRITIYSRLVRRTFLL